MAKNKDNECSDDINNTINEANSIMKSSQKKQNFSESKPKRS